MDIVWVLLIVAVVVLFWVIYEANKSTGPDVNQDGKVDIADAKAALDKTVAEVKTVADVNKDGKVDVADAKEVVTKAKTAVKKATAKKPAVKAKTAGASKSQTKA